MMEQDVAAIQAALRKQGVGTEQRPKWVTLGECCDTLGLNLPKLHRLIKAHQIPIQRNQRDLRQRFIDLNEVKRALAS